ncbi:MAG: DUF3078 domain-containing protein [Bacteroidales bacterium]
MRFYERPLLKAYFATFLLLALGSVSVYSQSVDHQSELPTREDRSVSEALNILKEIYYSKDWTYINEDARELIQGLLVYSKYPNVDSLKSLYNRVLLVDTNFVYRANRDYSDSLRIKGYKAFSTIREEKEAMANELRKSIDRRNIAIPDNIYDNISKSVRTIPSGQGHILFLDGRLEMSGAMSRHLSSIDSSRGNEQRRLLIMLSDSTLYNYMESERQSYNNKLMSQYIDSINTAFTERVVERLITEKQDEFVSNTINNNLCLIRNYNFRETKNVNTILKDISVQIFDYIYHRPQTITLSDGQSLKLAMPLQNGDSHSSRFWVKNPQNDSLSLMIQSKDLNTIELYVADNVMFQRMQEQQKREFKNINSIRKKKDISDLGLSVDAYQPWAFETNATLTLSQVSMNKYWAKGGDDAFSFLTILNGKATYSLHKITWTNALLIEEGWNSVKDEPFKSTHDRLRINSDLTVQAIKKWYYSSGIEFETQLFTTYTYPADADKVPLYGILNPGTFRYNLGIQYKPKDNLQLRLSPFTLKYIFYTDTSKYNQTLQGVSENSTNLFDKGFEAEVNYNTKFLEKCKLTSRYRMFFEYADFTNSADILWENHLFIDLTDRINLNLRMDLYYNVKQKIPIYETVNGVESKVDEKAGLQIKEFFSVGFTWSLYRKPTKIRNQYRYY